MFFMFIQALLQTAIRPAISYLSTQAKRVPKYLILFILVNNPMRTGFILQKYQFAPQK